MTLMWVPQFEIGSHMCC